MPSVYLDYYQETVDVDTAYLVDRLRAIGYKKFKITVFPPRVIIPIPELIEYSTCIQASKLDDISFG